MSVIQFAPKLVSFYIFDSRYGQKEGEEQEKLLFYSPDTDGINTKVRNIGLSEAFTRFTSMFNKTSDCETIHTQKHCTVMLQPEPCIWMVMKIALAHSTKQDPPATTTHSSNSKDNRKSRSKISNTREKGGGSSPVNISARKSSTKEKIDPSSRADSISCSETNGSSVLRSQTNGGSSSNLTVSDVEQTNTRGSNSSLAKDPVDSCSVNSSTSNKSANELPEQYSSEISIPDTKAASFGDTPDCDSRLEARSNEEVCGSRESLDPNASSLGLKSSTISSTPVASLLTPFPVQDDASSSEGTETGARGRKNSRVSGSPTGSRSDLDTISEASSATQGNTSSSSRVKENTATEPAACPSTSRYDLDSVQASVLKAHLSAAYSAFAFMHHSFGWALQQHGQHGLRKLLEGFFEDYLRLVELNGGDVSSVWRGLSFLPLSQASFLRVYCCLAALRAAVPSVRATAFLYSSSVVWCDFDLESLRRLVHFLSYTGAFKKADHPATIKDDGYMQRFIGGVCGSTRVFVGRGGRGMVDPQAKSGLLGLDNCVATGKCVSDDRKECHLVLYTCAGAIIPIVLPASEMLTPALYERLARLLDSRVTQLAMDVTELSGGGMGGRRISHGKPSSSSVSPDGFKYIYHNKMNLAIKSTVLVEREHPTTGGGGGGGGGIGEDSDAASRSGGSWWFNKAAPGTSYGASSTAKLAPSLMNGDGSTSGGGVVSGGAFGLGGSAVVAPVEGATVLPWKVMQAIVDVQADMERDGLCEVVLKTQDDHWVVGRMGNGRHLFVTMAHASANLVEITDEVQRMCNAHFNSVFMLE